MQSLVYDDLHSQIFAKISKPFYSTAYKNPFEINLKIQSELHRKQPIKTEGRIPKSRRFTQIYSVHNNRIVMYTFTHINRRDIPASAK